MILSYRLYRPHLNSYATISTIHLRNLNVKNLKRLDSDLAKKYKDFKMMGGSLKTFFKKVGNFGRKVLSTMPRISRVLHKITGKALDFLNSDTGKAIVNTVGKAVETGLHLPGLSKVINRIPEVAKKGFDGLTDIINNIKKQNPGVSMEQAKDLVQNIYNTSKEIYKDYQDDKQKAEQKALEETKKTVDGVNEIVKDEGKQEISAGLLKAAKYLPLMSLVNPVYVEDKKGGMIPKFKKPSNLIKKYLGEQAVKEYPTAAVNKYAGRLYLAGQCGKPKGLPNPLAVAKGESQDMKNGTGVKKSKGKSLLEKLRNNEL